MAGFPPGECIMRHGPDVSIPIVITVFREFETVEIIDTCIEWREYQNFYMVDFPGQRNWQRYDKPRFHIRSVDK